MVCSGRLTVRIAVRKDMARNPALTKTNALGASFELTDEHRMLLDIRDSLYDGSWEEFKFDLEARAAQKPHVFETAPTSQDMIGIIRDHLNLIEQMVQWESTNGKRLVS